MRRQAAYLRVSTPQQSEALQRDSIQRAAAARGESVDLWFAEKVSGKAFERPELDSLKTLARAGEVSKVWVFSVSRLTRRGPYDLLTTVHELKGYGCPIISVTEPIDTEGPWGQVFLAALGAAAETELEVLRDRMAAARRSAEAKGKRWGRPRVGGTDRDLLRESLRLLVESGLTLRKAAKEAGLTYGTAQRIMAPPKKANDG